MRSSSGSGHGHVQVSAILRDGSCIARARKRYQPTIRVESAIVHEQQAKYSDVQDRDVSGGERDQRPDVERHCGIMLGSLHDVAVTAEDSGRTRVIILVDDSSI